MIRAKKDVLVTGGFHRGEDYSGQDDLTFNRIAQLGEEIGVNVLVVREDGLSSWEEGEERVRRADLIVSGVERPTWEAGILGGIGTVFNKPVVLVYFEGRKVSRMARGAPNVVAEIVYSTGNEAEEAVKHVFHKLRDIYGGEKREKLERVLFQSSLPSSLKRPANK